ncbi:MAG: hypothetical protein PHG84_07150 [Endomicrobiaceae bacterium]|nr:hypothetical protein [Endomicrobiaceae bacterium]
MKNKIIISLILSLIIVFTGTSDFASASGFEPPINSELRNYWDITHSSATNVNAIFDDHFNYLGGWANNVYYNGNLYNPCLSSDKRIRFALKIYDSSGTHIVGVSATVKVSCVDEDFYFLSEGPSGSYKTPAEYLNQILEYNIDSSYSNFYAYGYFNYGLFGNITARYLLYFDSSRNRHLLNDDYSEYSTAVNGTCGSANGGSFPQTPSTNLCATGTLFTGAGIYGVIDNGTSYLWTCMGSGENSTSENCSASVSVASAQCGYIANTEYTGIEPTGYNACINGSVKDMQQELDDTWSWTCEVSEYDFVSCSSYSDNPFFLLPSLPTSGDISCSDILDPQGFGECIASVLSWLFLPHTESMENFFALKSLLVNKIPFGYVKAWQNQISSLAYAPEKNLTFNMTYNDQEIPIVDTNSLSELAGVDLTALYFGFIRACLWIMFGVWVFNLGRSIFAHKQLTLDFK